MALVKWLEKFANRSNQNRSEGFSVTFLTQSLDSSLKNDPSD